MTPQNKAQPVTATQVGEPAPTASALDAALAYRRRGFNPTPVIGGQKAARLPRWTTTELIEADILAEFAPGEGVGLVLGPSSGGLVCLDYDSAEALWLLSRGYRAVAELLAIWPSGASTGVRHDAAGHLDGGLVRAGWTQEQVDGLVGLLCEFSGDDDQADRLNAVRSTFERHEEGGTTTGWPRLVDLLGEEKSVKAVLGWLGVTGQNLNDPGPACSFGRAN